MRTFKTAHVLLTVLCAGVWTYDALLLVDDVVPAMSEPPVAERAPVTEPSLNIAPSSKLPLAVGGLRDPFGKPKIRRNPSVPGVRPPIPNSRNHIRSVPAFSLLGILWSTSNPLATVRTRQGVVRHLAVGDALGEASIRSIHPSYVVLMVGTNRIVLKPSGMPGEPSI